MPWADLRSWCSSGIVLGMAAEKHEFTEHDLPADLIAEIYRLRWLIELSFRMFKQMLGCRHLLSTKQSGVEIQVYCAIIACLLIMLYTGRRPSIAIFEHAAAGEPMRPESTGFINARTT